MELCLFIPSFQFVGKMHPESQTGSGNRHCDRTVMANSDVVPTVDGNFGGYTNYNPKTAQVTSTSISRQGTSTVEKTQADCMQSVRESFRKQGISEQSTNILMCSWKRGTKKQYQVFISRWFCYCSERQINKFSPNVAQVIEFLTEQFNNGLGYDSLNTARGALSSLGINYEGFRIGSHPLIIRYMKGIFTLKPPQPKYTAIWDVQPVLKYLRKLSPVKHLKLKDLTMKLAMLVALTNAARVQSLHFLTVENIKKLRNEFVVQFSSLLKQNRPNYNVSFMTLKAYPPDRRLCVFTVLKEYLCRTRSARNANGCKQLFISYVKPYDAVSKDTISRWI